MSDIDREEELADSPEIWSVSKLQTIQTCGHKYKLRYIDKLPEQKGVALKFGSIVHHLIDLIHKGEINDIGELQEQFVDKWLDSKEWDWTGELMSPLQYKNRGLKMLRQYWKGHHNDKVVESEVKFTVPYAGTKIIRGIVDKIQEIEPDVFAVVDFKTSKNPPDPLVLRRDIQLTTYYYAAKELGMDVHYFAIHHLLSGDVYWTWRDEDDLVYLDEAFFDAFVKSNFSLYGRNIDYGCKWCPYKEQCLSVG